MLFDINFVRICDFYLLYAQAISVPCFHYIKCQVANNVVINKYLYNFSTKETKQIQMFNLVLAIQRVKFDFTDYY
jgi:hypothetical protein